MTSAARMVWAVRSPASFCVIGRAEVVSAEDYAQRASTAQDRAYEVFGHDLVYPLDREQSEHLEVPFDLRVKRTNEELGAYTS